MTRVTFVLLLLLTVALPVRAEPPPLPGGEGDGGEGSLTLFCTSAARADLPAETLRLAIQRELSAAVALSTSSSAVLSVTVERSNEARLRFLKADGGSIERSVELPQDSTRAIEVIAWVAGNLARNEAADLIAKYRRQSPPDPGPSVSGVPLVAERAPEKPPSPSRPVKPPDKAAARAESDRPPSPPLAFAPLNLSLFHPLALYPDSHRRRFAFELGLAYGRLGALGGAGLELGVLSVAGPLEGVALAGIALDVDGPTTGYTGALFYSGSRGDLTGVDTAFVSFRRGNVQGAQLATAFARADRVDGVIAATGLTLATDVRGANLAVAANVADSTEGVAAAAGVNVIRRVEGASLATGANIGEGVHGLTAAAGANVIGRVEGAALAAGANVSQEVKGVQIAVINVAERVRGAQIGIINVAGEVDGAAIGVVSIAKNGEIQATAWASNLAPLHASVKFRVGFAYSELGVAWEPGDDEYAFEQGLGAHLPLVGAFALEPGIHHSFTKSSNESLNEGEGTDRLHYRLRGVLRVARHLDVFAGGGLRHAAWGDLAGETDPEFFAGIALH
jgi:hypothetical protein